ncbi:MAG: ComEA family DNA-binding protein [Anaerolineales bacterium]|nr:ComEA family DNA-binding protein [Anaerolineales bacterium]
MASKDKREMLSPAWWIAYGVLCGVVAMGLVVFLTSPPRGTAVALQPQPSLQAAIIPVTVATRTVAPTYEPTIININAASAQELQKLPNIGPTTAQAIVNYRERIGQFEALDQLLNVSGIGSKTFEGLLGLISLENE